MGSTVELTISQEIDVVIAALKGDYENGHLRRKDYKAVRRILKYYMGDTAFNEYRASLPVNVGDYEVINDLTAADDFDAIIEQYFQETTPYAGGAQASRTFKVGDTVRILVGQYGFKAGDVTTIVRDDGSHDDECPYWVLGGKRYPDGICLLTHKLELIADPKKLLVGDTVEVLVDRVFDGKIGDRLVITEDDGSEVCQYWTGGEVGRGVICWDGDSLKLVHRPIR